MTTNDMTGGEPEGKNMIVRRFNDVDIGQRPDGYLNATAMCKAAGKEWKHYNFLQGTSEFLAELSRSVGIPTDVLVVAITTGLNEGRGTWVHPQVAYNLAQWCSPAFAVKVTEWIADIHNKGYATAEGVTFRDPMDVLRDPAAMRGLLLTYSEKVLELETTVAAQAPKVEAFDRIAAAEGSMCVTDAAKDLQVRPKDLFNWMSGAAGSTSAPARPGT